MNTELLKATLAAVEAAEFPDSPMKWDQVTWVAPDWEDDTHQALTCKTSACFAGWAVYLHDGPEEFRKLANLKSEFIYASFSDRAQEILGLTPIQGRRLFWYSNSLDTLRNDLRGYIS
jgi:hypothetical protein